MEGYVAEKAGDDRPWQGKLCQFFTRADVAHVCMRQLDLPRDLLSIRLLEPAAGQGAFILPLIPRLVRQCVKSGQSLEALLPTIRAFEIDPVVAASLKQKCTDELREVGVGEAVARAIVRAWVKNEDFLDAKFRTSFSHVVGNPPYIRWDAIPATLRASYAERGLRPLPEEMVSSSNMPIMQWSLSIRRWQAPLYDRPTSLR